MSDFWYLSPMLIACVGFFGFVLYLFVVVMPAEEQERHAWASVCEARGGRVLDRTYTYESGRSRQYTCLQADVVIDP